MSRVQVNGQEVDATARQIVSAHEPWTEVMLDTGYVVRVRLIITDVFEVEGQQGDGGMPLFATRSQQVLTVSPPQEGV